MRQEETMEEKQSLQNHRISLASRQFGMITGVSDVVSFDVTEIVLETEMGMLMIKALRTQKEDTENKETLCLEGCLNKWQSAM